MVNIKCYNYKKEFEYNNNKVCPLCGENYFSNKKQIEITSQTESILELSVLNEINKNKGYSNYDYCDHKYYKDLL